MPTFAAAAKWARPSAAALQEVAPQHWILVCCSRIDGDRVRYFSAIAICASPPLRSRLAIFAPALRNERPAGRD
jgi:hypothetical protein